jgi:hypothetical protein
MSAKAFFQVGIFNLTENGDWQYKGQVNIKILYTRVSHVHFVQSGGLTWKSPKFEADVYKKLTVVNWIAE